MSAKRGAGLVKRRAVLLKLEGQTQPENASAAFCRAFARAALGSLRQQGALSGRLFYAAAAALEEDAPQAEKERP